MLVDVLFLRRNGVKKSQAELRLMPPTRLTLTVERVAWSGAGPDKGVTTRAHLSRGEYRPPYLCVSTLENATLARLRDDSFVLVGRERLGRAPDSVLLPQAWWCRVVRDESAPPLPMEPVSDQPAPEAREAQEAATLR